MLTTFFVDVDGAPGGDGSSNWPFVSIQEGIDAAGAVEGADSVYIRGGTYTENLLIDDSDPVVLRGAGGVSIESKSTLEDTITILSGDVTLQRLSVSNGRNGIVATGQSLYLLHVNVSDSVGIAAEDDIVDGNGVVATEVNEVTVIGGNYSNNGSAEDMHGLLVESADVVRLTSITAQGNGQHGVDVNRIGTLVVSSGVYSHNVDGDGIHVDRTDHVTIHGGVFSDNDGDGIDLRRVNVARISGVDVSRNGNEGLEVDDTDTLFVTGSQFVDNDEDGLDIDDTAHITIIGVLSMGNGFDDPDDPGSGLQIEAEDDNDTDSALVIGSRFIGNAADGIQASEPAGVDVISRLELVGVTLAGNGQSGLDVQISGLLEMSGVKSYGNGEDDIISTG